eukprot:gene19226-21153_t
MSNSKESKTSKEEKRNIAELYDNTSLKNLKSIHCEFCGSTVIKESTASIKIDQKFSLPLAHKKNDDTTSSEDINEFWQLNNMMDFENVGFSNTVDNIKYLCCADCEIGPIGYHDVTDKTSFYVAVSRVVYK